MMAISAPLRDSGPVLTRALNAPRANKASAPEASVARLRLWRASENTDKIHAAQDPSQALVLDSEEAPNVHGHPVCRRAKNGRVDVEADRLVTHRFFHRARPELGRQRAR